MRNKPEWQWYAEAWGKGDGAPRTDRFFAGGASRIRCQRREAALRLAGGQAVSRRGVGTVNEPAGRAPMASRCLSMRAAPLGNISHSHADQNAIVAGRVRIAAAGEYRHSALVRQSIQQGVVLDHQGAQRAGDRRYGSAENGGSQGQVARIRAGRAYDYVVGETTSDYGDHVKRYRRHLVFLKPDVLVVFDEVQASRPVSLKFWLHGRAPFTIDSEAARVSLTYEKAGLNGLLLSPGGLRIEQTDKYPLAPEMGETQTEWHLAAESKQKHADTRLVAVMGIGKAGQAVALDDAQDVSGQEKIAVRFRRAGKPVTVSVSKNTASVTID